MFPPQCLTPVRPRPDPYSHRAHSVVGKTDKLTCNRRGGESLQTMEILGGSPKEVVTSTEACGRRGMGSVSEGRLSEVISAESVGVGQSQKGKRYLGRGPTVQSRSGWKRKHVWWHWRVRWTDGSMRTQRCRGWSGVRVGGLSGAMLGLCFLRWWIPWRVDIIGFVWLHFNNIFSFI